jgi:hypothetical protein
MANKTKGVCIRVHPLFFDNFESKRKSYEQRFKVSLSQIKTSELIFRDFLNNNNPQVKPKRPIKKYYPKRFNNRGLFI